MTKEFNLEEIPMFLTDSKLYESLENTKTISLQEKYIPSFDFEDTEKGTKLNITMESLDHILEIIRFWMVKDDPYIIHQIYDFVEENCDEDFSHLSTKFHDLDLASEIEILANMIPSYDKNIKTVCKKIGANGYANLLKYLMKYVYPFRYWDLRNDEGVKELVDNAVKNGHVNIMKLVVEKELYFNKEDVMYEAASNKHIDMIKYFLSINDVNYDEISCDSDNSVDSELAYQDRMFNEVASSFNVYGFELPKNCDEFFVLDKDMQGLEFLKSQGFKFTSDACVKAAEHGFIDKLKYLHENGADWDSRTCQYSKNLECLKYAHENGCSWTSGNRRLRKKLSKKPRRRTKKSTVSPKPLNDHVVLHFLRSGNIECLKYAVENGAPHKLTDVFLEKAARGDLEFVKFCLENDCNITVYAGVNAILTKNYKILEFLIENGLEKSTQLFDIATEIKNLKVMKILHKYNYPISQKIRKTCQKNAACFNYLVNITTNNNT